METKESRINSDFTVVWDKGYCGFKNSNGEMITECKYDKVLDFSNGIAAVNNDDMWGFIDKEGNEITPIQYYTPLPFGADFIGEPIPVKLDEKWGYINRNGKIIVPFIYDQAFFFGDKSQIAPVRLGEGWGYIDKQGKVIIPIEYDNVSYILNDEDGLLTVKRNGKVGLLDYNGRIIASITYEFINEFNEGFSVVKWDGKYGFIDMHGKVVIPIVFEKVGVFTDGLAIVKKVDIEQPYFIDTKGNDVKVDDISKAVFLEDDYYHYWCGIEEETDSNYDEINDADLEEDLRIEFFRTIDEANKLGARIWAKTVKKFIWQYGAVEAAKRIIYRGTDYMPSGFLKLCEIRRLDLSFENTIQSDKFRRLFSDHIINQAKSRLEYYGFKK